MAKVFFTSDTHFNDPRFDVYFRPFKSIEDMNGVMISNWNNLVSREDTVWHLGDFTKTVAGYNIINDLNGKINLILGNYDEEHLKDYSIFNKVLKNNILDIGGTSYFLTHKPEDYNPSMMNLVGHIHGLWKVQRNMINVGTDAWHFFPVTEDEIKRAYKGIQSHYDKNVFIGEYIKKQVTSNKREDLIQRALIKLSTTKNTITWKKPNFQKEMSGYFENSDTIKEFKKHGLFFSDAKGLTSFLNNGKLQKINEEDLDNAKNIINSLKDFDTKLEDQTYNHSYNHLEKCLEKENLFLEAPIVIKFNDGTLWGFSGNRRFNLAKKNDIPILCFVVNQKDFIEDNEASYVIR